MKTSARDMVDWIRASIRSLALNPEYGKLEAVYDELSSLSGISRSSIMKLHLGQALNPTASTIDKLVSAIKQATAKAAA